MDEPIKAVREIEISVTHGSRPHAGMFQTRPTVQVHAEFCPSEFGHLWAMAVAGQLKFADLVFQEPRHNKATVINLSFSSHREE